MESMITARQVAELLGVHENWVYDQAANGELPSYKIGGTRRFDPDELRGWIAEHRAAERKQPEGRKDKAKTKRSRPKATRRPDDSQPRLFE
jgi:excisionase family DNA binding protein